jgi:hydrogenase maturation protein HypF
LEAACDGAERGCYSIEVTSGAEGLVLDPRETIRQVVADVRGGTAVAVIASRFHAAIARGTVEACLRSARACGTDLVVLSGGVFQNRRLLEAASCGLDAAGLRVLTPQMLPVNDGAIAYGQAAVAARRSAA